MTLHRSVKISETFIQALMKPDWLLKGKAKEVPLEECRYNYSLHYKNIPKLNRGISDDIICVSDKKSGADTCKGLSTLFSYESIYQICLFTGDSGSALTFLDQNKFYIVGVTSSGVSCSNPLPSFYARVYSYLSWIEEIVWPSS
jgi:hypothetical protein